MSYTAKDITVLEGLEPVRKRPGMYIGGVGAAGLHHLVWEILDNSIDEAMNGHASTIAVTLHADGTSVTVTDNGRGIPVDVHAKTKKSALEVIFTVLHAGGKFEHGSYKTAGGLHGVGASVVNALSRELVATVKRDGQQWEMRFKQGKPDGGAEEDGRGPRQRHHRLLQARPDDLPEGRVRTADHPRPARGRQLPAQGRQGHLRRPDHRHEADLPARRRPGRLPQEDPRRAIGAPGARGAVLAWRRRTALRLEVVLQWTESTDEHLRSYVNGIPTGSGGTHENGFRAGLGKAVRNFIETHDLTPKGVTLTAEDIREGLIGVLSVFLAEPQFQGQTKDRLNNPEVTSAVDGLVRPALEHWLNHNISIAEAIVARIILAARAREASRAAQAEVVRKGPTAGRVNLPGKLADCTHPGAITSELFIVEGDSAGGSAKQGRDRARAGDPAAARQGPQHRGHLDRQGAGEQGAGRPGDGARLRRRQGLRPVAAALRQGDPAGRRRRRRPPHRHAAADLPLPAPAAADRRRARLPGAAAALPHRHRQGDVLGARRRTTRPRS